MAKISRLRTDLGAETTGLVLFDALNGYLHPADPAKIKFLAERNVLANLQRLLAGAIKGSAIDRFSVFQRDDGDRVACTQPLRRQIEEIAGIEVEELRAKRRLIALTHAHGRGAQPDQRRRAALDVDRDRADA